MASLLTLIGVANLAAGVIVLKVMPTSAFRDFLSILFRAFYRLEVRGLENVEKAGPNAIIALNHVSFLDAPLALSLLDKEPVFAVDHGIAQRWWVKPFLRVTKAMPLDPTRPLATRTLINAVKNGETLIIFPEGRLTVTGSLMKVYDGAGLIAEKSGAKVVPVKIEGLEKTAFSRLSRNQVRRRWWPKVIVTVMSPVALTVDPALKGKNRRRAAGAALYDIMSDLVFDIRLHRPQRDERPDPGRCRPWLAPHRAGGPGHGHAQLFPPRHGRQHPRPEADAARRRGQGHRADAAQCQRRGRDLLRPGQRRARAGDDQLLGRPRQRPSRPARRRRWTPSSPLAPSSRRAASAA